MVLWVFVVMMVCLYWRPFGLPLWVYSTLGALACVAISALDSSDIMRVWAMVWDSTLTLVGLIMLAVMLEKLLFFEYVAMLCIRALGAKGSYGYVVPRARFYVFLVLFGGALGAVFANDGAILILTPFVLALFKARKESGHKGGAFTPLVVCLLAVCFVSDFASNTFVISNLTNIITAQFFSIDSRDFTRAMLLPQASILLACLGLYVLVRRYLPPILRFYDYGERVLMTNGGFLVCLGVLGVLLLGVLQGRSFGVPLCAVVAVCAGALLLYGRLRILPCLKGAPFGIVAFSLGLFIVVFSVQKAYPLQDLLSSVPLGIFSVGLGSSLGSSIINNLPMVMLGNLALSDFVGLDSSSRELLMYAHLLGCNVGSKLTPIGSLATLLWLASLKRYDIYISFWQYMLVAMLVVPLMLCVGLLGLYLYTLL
ncbi:ArsB/NhaD family transporter [uncultured Helicobacter sp.]|uniref:ArsB/NhaD family transporter n=1 Tax=uncultured Helicobacter sp. TaxID=175537 RepID=UPI002632F148|nr:ArsB/NhaD family transporter [uncultured Helicobacter sp.]